MVIPELSSQRGSRPTNSENGARENPYLAFVAAIDPDGTMDDGRAYVGGARHYVDKAVTRSANNISNQQSPPTQAQSQVQVQVQTQAQSQVQAPAQTQSQTQSKQQLGSSRQPAQHSFKQPPQQPKYSTAERVRGSGQSRWSGKPLATANSIPEGFFATAKPVTPASSSNASPQQVKQDLSPQHSDSGQFRDHRPETKVPEVQHEFRPRISDVQRAMGSVTVNEGNVTKVSQHPEQARSNWNTLATSSETAGWGLLSSRTMPSRAGRFGDISDDEGSVSTSRGSHSVVPASNDGDPLYLQYPIGDGCYVTVTIHVDRSAQAARRRIPIEMPRLQSGYKVQTMEQLANIFKEAVEDEKSNAL
ncbi:hypothetical protein BCR41DRAFT_367665 [Lobosporangium transversale]|uniref:Uncharacterized protein n=1 Tax=Lobosporangium transversale TaxID=64571 RepID=A0A1Y2GZT9_9FUNG|nr:hypothetical protein BCR41DRAFT_367665 [Lobosporangium transversale]ORZ27304.1 hypothetical protein BCR41DRAFT_367665 [Lobosporangium transversale]|eukprot:XP_021885031.1 hypothetical protein BCR41DRAFT_367665 [Lobosporangium transversale]